MNVQKTNSINFQGKGQVIRFKADKNGNLKQEIYTFKTTTIDDEIIQDITESAFKSNNIHRHLGYPNDNKPAVGTTILDNIGAPKVESILSKITGQNLEGSLGDKYLTISSNDFIAYGNDAPEDGSVFVHLDFKA